MKKAAVVILVFALAGCATLSRLNSYGGGLSDANFQYEGRSYSASLHPKEDVLLIRPATMSGIGSGFLQGATMGLYGNQNDYSRYRDAVTHLISGTGCEVQGLSGLDAQSGYWEATWHCPPNVNLRQLMESQRGELRHGSVLTTP